MITTTAGKQVVAIRVRPPAAGAERASIPVEAYTLIVKDALGQDGASKETQNRVRAVRNGVISYLQRSGELFPTE